MASKALKELRPNKRNPRLPWSDSQREAFQKSLKEFGDLSGVFYNIKTKQLGGGHKRVEEFNADPEAKLVIAERLDKPDATGTIAWGYVETNGTRFSYREVNWPKSKELAANIAANQHGADFDWMQVSQLIQELGEGIDLDVLGFSQSELVGLTEADWTKSPIEPGEIQSGHSDEKITLTPEQYEVFQAAKKKTGKEDDAEALVAICAAFIKR